MKIFALIITLFLTVSANAQLGNISKLPIDTVFTASTVVPGVDTTGANKRPYSLRVKDVVKYGADGNFKTVNGESIIGSGDVIALTDSIYVATTAANDSLVVPNAANIVQFNITGDPGTQTTLALVLPGTAHPSNELDVFFSDDVTTLAITSTGGTTVYSPTAIATASAGDVIKFKRIGTVYFRKP